MEKKYVVGVDLGGTKIYTALVDLEGNIIKEKILKSENELAIIILFYEFDLTLEDKEKIIGTAHSWILLYQLYLEDLIEKDVFQERSKVKKNIHFYNKLKYNKFSFYKKI